MTEQIYSESARKIQQSRELLEDKLHVRVVVKGKIVFLEGSGDDEYFALQVIEAINMGFSVAQALDLKNEDFILQKIPIKKIANRNNLAQVRARVIGTERKVLRTIEYLTGCEVVLHDNMVGIIGNSEAVKRASFALKRIIAGSRQPKMYAWLEKKKAEEMQGF